MVLHDEKFEGKTMIADAVTVSENDMRKLLGAASPEAALLYLYVQAGNDPSLAEGALS